MNAQRPVDMSDTFMRKGWEYCRYLITDPRSDEYLRKHHESSKLAAPQQEAAQIQEETTNDTGCQSPY